MLMRLSITAALLLGASPAMAQSAAQIPEASGLTLFALGVAGVIIGRRLSMRKSDED